MKRVSRYNNTLGTLLLSSLLLLPLACTEANGDEPRQEQFDNTGSVVSASTNDGAEDDIEQGLTEIGDPYLGDPDAPFVLLEYSDFLCPFCARYAREVHPELVRKYVASGKLKMIFKQFPIESLHPTADIGASFSHCAAQVDDQSFWTTYRRLFDSAREWGELADPSEYLLELGDSQGLDTRALVECMSDESTQEKVSGGVVEAGALGFTGTPSFVLVNTETDESSKLIGAQSLIIFSKWIDAALAGDDPEVALNRATTKLPSWLSDEGTRAGLRAGVTVHGDPYKGDQDAPIRVVEFSNFDCANCRMHYLGTQPKIDSDWTNSGKVMWIYKNLPDSENPRSIVASAAGECALRQDAFWSYQTTLVSNPGRWEGEDIDSALSELASEVGMDTASFTSCLNGREAMLEVVRDIADGGPIVRETPTFVITYNGKAVSVAGLRGTEEFLGILQSISQEIGG